MFDRGGDLRRGQLLHRTIYRENDVIDTWTLLLEKKQNNDSLIHLGKPYPRGFLLGLACIRYSITTSPAPALFPSLPSLLLTLLSCRPEHIFSLPPFLSRLRIFSHASSTGTAGRTTVIQRVQEWRPWQAPHGSTRCLL